MIASMTSFVGMVIYVYRRDSAAAAARGESWPISSRRGRSWAYRHQGPADGRADGTDGAAGHHLVGLVNREGLMTTAAYGAAMQLFAYIQMPAMAIGGAVSAMAAQYIGAGKWDGLHAVTRAGVVMNLAFTGTVTALLLLFDRPVLVLFLGPDSPAVTSPGTSSFSPAGASSCSG